MADGDFVHLRVHTAYSLSEGAIRIPELAELCRAHRMPAVAMTDTNNLFGGMEFSVTLAGAGIQPIIGCQLALSGTAPTEAGAGRSPPRGEGHIVLLVQNAVGYRNLLKLLATAHLDGTDGREAEVPLSILERHGGGLIALTGGPEGALGRLLRGRQAAAAAALVERLQRAFPGRLYVELMRHGLDAEAEIEPALIRLAEDHQLPLVATNEAFFPGPDMHAAHDALICIAEGAHLADTERRRLTAEHYFKSAAEMRALFADLPDAADNTVLIAQRCAFMIEPVKPILPPYDPQRRLSEEEVLAEQARQGLGARLAAHVLGPEMSEEEREAKAKPYRERLAYELQVISQMGFAGYFLIVAEFIQWARAHGIPVGPGRGSGAGSVVAWALTITDLDPLRFGLLFERFLNPERVSMPDFDIDFCQDRRDEVIRHVQARYGRERVAQIITFGKLQARAVLRDVGRVLGMPYGQVDKLCKLVPSNPANPVSLAHAIEADSKLKAMIDGDETVARLFDIAGRLEGLYRHASTHAAGVVIGDRPLDQQIPLYRDPRSDIPVTGFNMKWVEKAGLVKFDFLGLKTLTVLANAVAIVERQEGRRIDLGRLPLDDARTFEMLAQAETVGVFQLESAGMRDALRKLRPDKFEDIIAVVALYRPGPMDNIPSYIRRKHGEEKPDYLYPTLQGILSETHGIIIYQEQVMQIAQELSGYSLGAADILRRAMGKKIRAEMERQRELFVDGARARGVPADKASHIFELVSKFAGYGFNKSHAAAYAMVAYQTAYMKANHPLAFFAASMTLELDHPEKISVFRQELARLGIPLLPPDINASDVVFTVDGAAGGIRYGLAAIKNVGAAAMQAIVAERQEGGPFATLEEFSRRIDGRLLNRRQLENLARGGAFDGLNANRKQVFEAVEMLLRRAGAAANERSSGQMGLFAGDAAVQSMAVQLPDTPDWPPMQRLRQEFEAIGFYLSAHPLDAYERALTRLNVRSYGEVVAHGRAEVVMMAGTVMAKKVRTSGQGNRYAFVELSDRSGSFEAVVFSELLAAAGELLEVGNALLIRAAAQPEGDSLRLSAQSLELLDDAVARAGGTVALFVDGVQPLPAIRHILDGQVGGRCRVMLIAPTDAGHEVEVTLAEHYAVDAALLARLRAIPDIREVREL